MDQNTLVDEEIEAGEEFLEQLHKTLPFKVAFWIKVADDGNWCLYVASEQFNEGSLRAGYTEVTNAWKAIKNPNLDSDQVKLVGTTDPFARAVLDIAARFDGRLPRRYNGTFFGGRSIDGSYFYPLPAPVAGA